MALKTKKGLVCALAVLGVLLLCDAVTAASYVHSGSYTSHSLERAGFSHKVSYRRSYYRASRGRSQSSRYSSSAHYNRYKHWQNARRQAQRYEHPRDRYTPNRYSHNPSGYHSRYGSYRRYSRDDYPKELPWRSRPEHPSSTGRGGYGNGGNYSGGHECDGDRRGGYDCGGRRPTQQRYPHDWPRYSWWRSYRPLGPIYDGPDDGGDNRDMWDDERAPRDEGGNHEPQSFSSNPPRDDRSAAQTAANLLNGKRHRPDELLIEVPQNGSDQLKTALAEEYGVEVRDLGTIELINARIWQLTLRRGQDLREVLERLLQDNRVMNAQPNYVYLPVQGSSAGSTSTSPSTSYSPATLTPGGNAGNNATGLGVSVAVIDTCIDGDHAELKGTVIDRFDALSAQTAQCEPEDHGTAIAGLIGGRVQVKGLAPNAQFLSARALALNPKTRQVDGSSREMVQALNWALQKQARLANLSFTGPNDPLLKRAIDAASQKGLIMIAAAGNAGPSSDPLYPAAYDNVIAVTANDARGRLYTSANRGSYICVSARGVDVIVAHVHDQYGTDSGTSFAAAQVTGLVAQILEKNPNATPDEVRTILQTTATAQAGLPRKNDDYGYGIINAKQALAYAASHSAR